MNKAEEPSQTLSMTEMNRFVSSSMRSLEEKNQVVVVTKNNKPYAAILPVKAYQDLVNKAKPLPESAQSSFTPLTKPKPERQSPAPYPELTLRLPMDGTKDWVGRQLTELLELLLEINKAGKAEAEEAIPVSESGGCL
jgi:PHD/YefM family antitoxin component YafN of YafNO toxin-antitoxin module